MVGLSARGSRPVSISRTSCRCSLMASRISLALHGVVVDHAQDAFTPAFGVIASSVAWLPSYDLHGYPVDAHVHSCGHQSTSLRLRSI